MNLSVSVIIPNKNAEPFLVDTLDSCLIQDYVKEIIIVDDHSTDGSLEILLDFQLKNPDKIKVFQSNDYGSNHARNFGYSKSSCDLIQFLDADDILATDKIKSQVKVFEKFGLDIISLGKWDRFTDSIHEARFPDRTLDKDWDNPIDWLLNSWEGKGMAQTAAWLTPRKLIDSAGPWNEQLKINQDGEFFCRVLLNAKEIKFCSESKVYYRSGLSNSISQNLNKEKANSLLISYQLYMDQILKVEDTPRVRHALMMNFLQFIYQFYNLYPEYSGLAKEKIRELGFKRNELCGGKNFRLLSGIFGFERLLKLRKIIKGY